MEKIFGHNTWEQCTDNGLESVVPNALRSRQGFNNLEEFEGIWQQKRWNSHFICRVFCRFVWLVKHIRLTNAVELKKKEVWCRGHSENWITNREYKLEATNVFHLAHIELVPTPTHWRSHTRILFSSAFYKAQGNPGKLASWQPLELMKGYLLYMRHVLLSFP